MSEIMNDPGDPDEYRTTRKVLVDKNVYNYLLTSCTTVLKELGFVRRLTTEVDGDQLYVCGPDTEDNKRIWDGFLVLYEHTRANMSEDTIKVTRDLIEGSFVNDLQRKFNCICRQSPDDMTSLIVTCMCSALDNIREYAARCVEENGGPDPVEVEANNEHEAQQTIRDLSFPPTGYDIGGIYHLYLHITDITTLHVDALCNQSNPHLENSSGVAKQLSDRAGPQLDNECKAIIKERKEVPTGHVIKTASGDLPCKVVLHAVVAKWSPFYTLVKEQECSDELEATYANVLKAFKEANFSSIAMNPLGSGQFRVPHKLIATSIFRSIINQATHLCPSGPSHSRQIHVVDATDSILKLVKGVFDDACECQGHRVIVVTIPREEVLQAVAICRDSHK